MKTPPRNIIENWVTKPITNHGGTKFFNKELARKDLKVIGVC